MTASIIQPTSSEPLLWTAPFPPACDLMVKEKQNSADQHMNWLASYTISASLETARGRYRVKLKCLPYLHYKNTFADVLIDTLFCAWSSALNIFGPLLLWK